jgi:hypothetical protein
MPTALQLASTIESSLSDEVANSVKVCRPDMESPLGTGNPPYRRITSSDSSSTGVELGEILVKAQTDETSEFTLLSVGYMMEVGNNSSYQLTLTGKRVLTDYQKTYRPFDSENNNMWNFVVDHFETQRNLAFVDRLEIFKDGTNYIGKVTGFHLVGDGMTNTDSRNEFWIFKATPPWDSSGNIKSWKYSG